MNDFQVGEYVYYVGEDDQFRHDFPYRLWVSRKIEFYDIFTDESRESISKDFINSNFISTKEYNDRIFSEKSPKIGDYKSFKNFMSGDKIYYIGDQKDLELDVPYIVKFHNPITGYLKIQNLDTMFPHRDFISEEKYKELSVKKEDDLMSKIYFDTINHKLIWTKPYIMHEWFRSIIKLDNPPNAYIRIDLRRFNTRKPPDNKWVMVIYYHRNKYLPNKIVSSEDNCTLIRNINENDSLIYLVEMLNHYVK